MLTDLNIKNIAIIDSLHVSFGAGLNILTGETGAGKSIIIDAVELLLGGRASAELIRAGADEATVEAVFDLSESPDLDAMLAEAGIEANGELLVKRVVAASGRNRVFIGGSLSTAALLGEVSRRLINIYGQHESQTLLRPENHLLMLDGFAGSDPLRAEFSALYAEYRHTADQLKALEEGERDREHRIDLLSFQLDEITKASLQSDEEEELEAERTILTHSGKLFSASRGGYETVYAGEGALLGQLRRTIAAICDAEPFDPALVPLRESLDDAYARLEDVALALRDYSARIESDPDRLAQVDDRLDLISRLKRKYGATLAEVLDYGEQVGQELALLRNSAEARGGLEERLAELSGKMTQAGLRLSEARRAAALRLAEAMKRELAELSMPNAQFEVAMEPLADPRPTGLDRVEFLFSPNPGEPPRPLARVASGGELSRLMLALKQLHPESDVPTLVFDEVDTGIGGATSAQVGRKLKHVAVGQQVLCITHLPQVAAFADSHFRVEKLQESGRTITRMVLLEGEERVNEMARMLGGVSITDTTRGHARELIKEAELHAAQGTN
ncbi:DNA repair protein RecN [Geobacter sp. OR-1]|uniref:DNA repair protein RecN n=1 Tax=Geobacter sp. OR-1 TaxID=1266765 RepID=UPI0005419CEB|nr:DNA repair protein RecN [Geobacter sp. OR-1]GAM07898.1 DNA repair protein RecN [Geobacter sp. OR-1]